MSNFDPDHQYSPEDISLALTTLYHARVHVLQVREWRDANGYLICKMENQLPDTDDKQAWAILHQLQADLCDIWSQQRVDNLINTPG